MSIASPPAPEDSGYRLEPHVARAFARFSGGYWRGASARQAWALTVGLLLLLLVSVGVTVAMNQWNRWFFDSLENRDVPALGQAVLVFALIIAAMAAIGVGIVFARETLQLRWRQWIVASLLDRWLSAQRFQRLSASGKEPQNPEYRIADDTRWATEPLVDLGIGLVLALVNAAAFITILWGVGGSYTLTLSADLQITIPAYLVIVALAYGTIASWLMLKVGAALPGCVARRNEAEGHFRFGMMRLRDNAESVALMGGGPGEREILARAYSSVVNGWRAIVGQHVRLTWITNSSGPMIPIVPLLFAAPKYIAGDLTLGQVTQLAAAFVQVQIAISWLVDHYGKIAEWYASARRVMEIVDACDDIDASTVGDRALPVVPPDTGTQHRVWQLGDVAVAPGQWVQITGESSTGKSTLVRALAGLKPGTATAIDPDQAVVPQRSYLPPGTLREVLAYPAISAPPHDDALRHALVGCGLETLTSRLDESTRWGALLSLGEQQRLSIARVMLRRPRSLILDDALSAIDERGQRALLDTLRAALPNATILLLARRPICADRFDLILPIVPTGSNIAS